MSVAIKSSRLFNYEDPYYEGFVFSLIIGWLPFKLMAYIAPFLFVLWFILRSRSGSTLIRTVLIVLIFLFFLFFYSVLYSFSSEKFIIQNAFLSFLTYGSFLIFLVLPNKVGNPKSISKYFRLIKLVILVESFLGIVQVVLFTLTAGVNFDLSTGDVVQGSLNPLSFLNPGGNFNNQIYTCNLIMLLIFYVPYAISNKRNLWVCFIGVVAILLASVWHLLIAIVLAMAIIFFFFKRTYIVYSKKFVLAGLFSLCIFSLTIIIQPKNFSLISHYYSKIQNFESPKAIVAHSSLTQLPKEYPFVFIVGLGPGQYESRAGLIGTGKYFGDFSNPTKLPVLVARSSKAFDQYIYPKWYEVATNPDQYGNSTMSRPFFSMLSIIIEFGFLFFVLLIVLVGIEIFGLRKIGLSSSNLLGRFYSFSCAIVIVFLAIISLFENYLEVAHAIFVGLLLLKYFLGYTKNNIQHQTNTNG